MPLSLLQGDASDVRRELARLGLSIAPSRVARDLLTTYIQVFPVEERARCVEKLGWYQDVFITADKCIGNSQELMVFQNNNAIEPALSVSGTVDQWRHSIGRLAAGNSRFVFSLSCAFAPALAAIAGEDSGGFHLRGSSSCGKSTALKLAASVWGKPSSYTRLWRATANGLEGLATLHNDGLLILDELSQIDPKEAGEAAYLLANGQGKTRASRRGLARQSTNWSLLFLSAGEESLTSLMARIGQRTNAGQEICLADIEADAECKMGIIEKLHEQVSPAAMVLALKDYANRYHGAVGLAWLEAVVKNRSNIIKILADSTAQFVDENVLKDVSGQVIRVARRFALAAAAGELATSYGLTGWKEREAVNAASSCFKAWLESFGSTGNREERAILSQVRGFFQAHGASRFDNITNPNHDRIHNRAGFYRVRFDDEREHLVLTEIYRKELCKGFDPKMVTRVLMEKGWLVPGNDGKSSQKPRVKGLGTIRCYVFNARVWDDELCPL